MKKQMINTLIAIATFAPALSLAATITPFDGEVRLQDELIIIKEKIVCTGHIVPIEAVGNVNPADVQTVKWTFGYTVPRGTGYMLNGDLDGDLISIRGDFKDGRLGISAQESRKDTGELPSYMASTMGKLSAEYGVNIDYRRNGKSASVHCGVKK